MPANEPAISLSDKTEFSHLFSSCQVQVYRYLYGMIGGPLDEVEDLTAETFSRAWMARHRFNGSRADARGWLLTIARNLAFDRHRRQKASGVELPIEQLPALAGGSTPEEEHLQEEQRENLWRLLQKLPAETKEILVLRYILEWRVVEIAAHLEKKENTISMNIHRALKRLQQLFTEESHSTALGDE